MFYRLIEITIVLLFSFASSFAFSAQTSELNETMKKIGFSYKQILKADTIEQAQLAVADMEVMIEKSRVIGFKKDVEVESLEGLGKVEVKLQAVTELLKQNDLAQAKKVAADIDELRKHYHKLHEPPGFLELLFGK